MGFLIDSAVLIALERERLSLDQITADLSEHLLAISAITASELLLDLLPTLSGHILTQESG